MGRAARVALIVAAALASLGFVALAAWQLQRLTWKQDLIARIERQVNAAPVPAPGASAPVTQADEYRRLRLRGEFGAGEVLVQATTALGGGHWVLAPLRLETGETVLVNRGFVPPEQRALQAHAAPSGPVELVGLLRLTETGGGPLRRNDPALGRWYSRDVAGIAAELRLTGALAPYFVDEVADLVQQGVVGILPRKGRAESVGGQPHVTAGAVAREIGIGEEIAGSRGRRGHAQPAVIGGDAGIAHRLAERLRQAVAQTPAPVHGSDGQSVAYTISIGVALLGCETTHPDDVLKRADSAMYLAKSTGRNRVCAEPVTSVPTVATHAATAA